MNRRHHRQSCRRNRGNGPQVRNAAATNTSGEQCCNRGNTQGRNGRRGNSNGRNNNAVRGVSDRGNNRREGCCGRNSDDASSDCPAVPLAISTIGMQKWNGVYEPEQGLVAGTMFPELNLPYCAGGKR